MAWPSTPIVTTHLDAGTDDPSAARPDIKLMADAVNGIMGARGVASGVCDLDASGLVPASRGGIPSGSQMLFLMTAAPLGWTQVLTYTDRVLRIVNVAGLGLNGSWTITGLTVDGHALSTAEMPAHAHNLQYVTNSLAAGAGTYSDIGGNGGNDSGIPTVTVGGGGSHTHGLTCDGSWRPLYVDVICASKD